MVGHVKATVRSLCGGKVADEADEVWIGPWWFITWQLLVGMVVAQPLCTHRDEVGRDGALVKKAEVKEKEWHIDGS